jgi:alpha-2-macroglobulin
MTKFFRSFLHSILIQLYVQVFVLVFLPIFVLCPTLVFCQSNLKEIAKRSHQVFAYRVTAAQAEQYTKNDSIGVGEFLSAVPTAVFKADRVDQKKLAPGQYVLISVEDNRIVAKLIGVSDLQVYPVNNRQKLQLLVIDRQGNFVKDAKIWVNGRKAPYRADAQSYWVRQKNPDEALIKVYTPLDTLFSSVWTLDELAKPVFKQKLENFHSSLFGKALTWIPVKLGGLFNKNLSHRSSNAGTTGMMVFNQPKYKKTDSVKLKAYLFDKKWKVYGKPVDVFLEFYLAGRSNKIFLNHITPSAHGSYIYQFPLSDTLPSDLSYSVVFRTPDDKRILAKSFRMEDYLLEEVSSLTIRSDKDQYYPGDSLHFYTSAMNANGLPVLDARARLEITVEQINRFYPDSMYIADTLWTEEKALLTMGETRFDFPASSFPKADLTLKVKMECKNGNNELEEKEILVGYRMGEEEFKAYIDGDSVIALFIKNGRPTAASGTVRVENGWGDTKLVDYPYKTKIDPLAASYSFYRIKDGRIRDSAKAVWDGNYEIGLRRISRGDSLGFVLDNPYTVPVSFTVIDGTRIVGTGKSSSYQPGWIIRTPNKHHAYRVTWQYRWKGEEQTREKNIALLYKMLDIRIKNRNSVFPGQKDTITVQVRDYKNKPVGDVNLTALSYNNQFNKDISVRDPPYLVKYSVKPGIIRNKYGPCDAYITKRYPLGNHTGWIHPFGLDTMLYYNMHFPEKGMLDVITPISEFLPQLSVHLVQKGERKEIYLLYVNRVLVYYNGVTEKMKEAYQTDLGYTQIGIRLYDQFIEIDSMYIQPSYKHDLCIDLDNLPAHTKITKLRPFLTDEERSLLERSCWNWDGHSKTGNAYIWQSERLVPMTGNRPHLVGPFHGNEDLHFFAPGDFDTHFLFESGYQYRLSKQILRLERTKIFPEDEKEIKLEEVKSPEWILGDTIPETPVITYTEPAKKEPHLKFSREDPARRHGRGDGALMITAARDTVIRYIILLPAEKNGVKRIIPGWKRLFADINPGEYTLFLVDKGTHTAEIKHLWIRSNRTLCIHADEAAYKPENPLVTEWINEAESPAKPDQSLGTKLTPDPATSAETRSAYPTGVAFISGKVSDRIGGHGIAGATVLIARSKTGVVTNADGSFVIKNIKPGKCALLFSSLGYTGKEVMVDVPDEGLAQVDISLNVLTQSLSGVVVMGYGAHQKKEITGSISVITGEDLSQDFMLQGTVAGLSIDEDGQSESNGKTLRTQFKDYAFWQPELLTDKEGNAAFTVEYPDNITGWQTYILGMDKKRRMGKAFGFVKSYKLLMAQLSLPSFLIAGDTAAIVGKALNYSNEGDTLQTGFDVDGRKVGEQTGLLKAKGSLILPFTVVASGKDSLRTAFSIRSNKGFKDGEEREIAILPKGSLETEGQFWILDRDTVVDYTAVQEGESVECAVQNNTLTMLLSEIDWLKKYPYSCMEQTASKLRGLLMEKTIKAQLKQPFSEEKTFRLLLTKLQKNQLYEGGWSWWENGKANLFITNYIIGALLPIRSQGMVETNIRNGLLFLQNQLPALNKEELLTTLLTMSEAKHLINYGTWLDKIDFDSLNEDEQWKFVKILQSLDKGHSNELKKLMNEAKPGTLGGLHWGEQNYNWYSDEEATTVIAFEVLQKEGGREKELKGIFQYFLEQRKSGFWNNTVASASIVSALLPYALSVNGDFNKPAVINITGDTSFSIRKYPFKWVINPDKLHQLHIQKEGGGLTYLTFYQQHWNNSPKSSAHNFEVHSYFEKGNEKTVALPLGARIKMIVEVNALQEADYVMVEIPIPAGCVYGSKEQSGWNDHEEFLKNKTLIFAEKWSKGVHRYELDLETRYSGTFTLNPANASLMYFPTFYGRNEMQSVTIRPD